MRSGKLPVLAGLFAVALSIIACGGSFTTANLADAWMSTDAEGTSRTTAYAQDATFFAQADLNNAPDDTVIKAVWTAVNAEDTDPNFVIGEAELATGDAVVTFDLTNDFLWPLGTYKVDLYLNDTLTTTVEFEVR